MLRFVLLEHDWPFWHLDLMLEQGNTLATWRLRHPLIQGVQTAERIADHRKHYLEYEGPVGNNRGHVKRVEHGFFQIEAGSTANTWQLVLHGTLHGRMKLEHYSEHNDDSSIKVDLQGPGVLPDHIKPWQLHWMPELSS